MANAEKNDLKPRQKEQRCLGKVTADFIWHMERLYLYAEPYDPERLLICFDKMPYQLIADVCQVLPAQPGKPRREDYEWNHKGSCNVLLAVETLIGRQHPVMSQTRKHADFTHIMQDLIKTYCPDDEELRVMLDNLSMHMPAAFSPSFEFEEAIPSVRSFL